MSAITTHILDTSVGKPAANVNITLELWKNEAWTQVGGGTTNDDGRVQGLLNDDFQFINGRYRIHFSVAEYFAAQGTEAFYPFVKIVFDVKDAQSHYHVPLLLNPFGYSTYRGS